MGHPTSASAARDGSSRLPLALLAMILVAGVLPRGIEGATGDPVLINEALVSHTGAPDTTEFVELFGVPGTPLTGLSLVAIEGDGAAAGTIDRRVDFPAGARLGGNGFYLVGNATGLAGNYQVVPDLAWGNDSLENGSQTLALVGIAGLGDVGSLVTGTETVLDAVGLTDAGPSDRWFWSAQPVVGPDDGFLPAGARRFTAGADTDTAADWVFADDRLGASNTPTPSTPYDVPDPTPEPTPAPPAPALTPSTGALWAMVDEMTADGSLAGGRAQLLTDRLERIDRYLAGGQDAAAAGQLQAFANQVAGLSPRWLSVGAAAELGEESAALRGSLSP
jgi:hypothetical protein